MRSVRASRCRVRIGGGAGAPPPAPQGRPRAGAFDCASGAPPPPLPRALFKRQVGTLARSPVAQCDPQARDRRVRLHRRGAPDKSLDVTEAYQIPHAAVRRLVKFATHTDSHRLVMTSNFCRDADCMDITEK